MLPETVPQWFVKGSICQINPRTFSKEGTINAVTSEIPFLKETGFSTLYLCPVFEEDASENRENWSERQKKSETGNPKNPYRMNDYFTIDSEYGTMTDLKSFIDTAHTHGLRVILDLVYLHIGPEAPVLKRHPEFAKQDEDGRFINGPWHFPLLNFENEGLREYLCTNMCYYIGVLDADGFRCDVGDGVPLDFWAEGKRRIRRIKKDAVLLLEGRDGSYMDVFEATYAFSWHETLYSVFSGEKDVNALTDIYTNSRREMPLGTLFMRDIDNHDTVTDWPERFEKRAGHDGMDLTLVLNFALDGIPMVYAGDELADASYLSMFANRFYPGKFEVTDREVLKNTAEGRKRSDLIRTLNTLRKESDALSYGDTALLSHDCPASVFAFRRSFGPEAVTFIGNLSNAPVYVTFTEKLQFVNPCLASGMTEITDSTVSLNAHGFILYRN